MKDKQESYEQYLNRVSGIVDFKPLNEADWRKETGQLTEGEQILQDLGITPEQVAGKVIATGTFYGHPIAGSALSTGGPTPGVGMSTVDPVLEAEELININQEPAMEAEELLGDFGSNSYPDVVYPTKLHTPMIQFTDEGPKIGEAVKFVDGPIPPLEVSEDRVE